MLSLIFVLHLTCPLDLWTKSEVNSSKTGLITCMQKSLDSRYAILQESISWPNFLGVKQSNQQEKKKKKKGCFDVYSQLF
jgi:hypothetical protein